MLTGYILTYNTDDYKDMMKINNLLFGRVVRVKRNGRPFNYYYKGLLSDVHYFKMSNGCYFITEELDYNNLNISLRKATLNLNMDLMTTAVEYFREKYNGEQVKNLW